MSDKIRCFLVDDEYKVLMSIANTLVKFDHLEIVGTAHSVQEAAEKIPDAHPDVVFLDIVMPLESGFELIYKFNKIDFEIVFVTSHAEYALQAIKNLALAYLLKPVSYQDFAEMLVILEEKLELKEKKNLYEALLHNMNAENYKDQKITIGGHNKSQIIRIGDIIRAEGWNRYTKLFTNDDKAYVSSYNIGKFAKLLDERYFYVPHKSHIINFDYVKSLLSEDKILMSDQYLVPIANRKRREFLNQFERVKRGIS